MKIKVCVCVRACVRACVVVVVGGRGDWQLKRHSVIWHHSYQSHHLLEDREFRVV